MSDSALTDLVLQTGPLGTLVVILGGLIRSWITSVGAKLDALTRALEQVTGDAARARLELQDLARRVERLEKGSG